MTTRMLTQDHWSALPAERQARLTGHLRDAGLLAGSDSVESALIGTLDRDIFDCLDACDRKFEKAKARCRQDLSGDPDKCIAAAKIMLDRCSKLCAGQG